MSKVITIVDDEKDICELISVNLRKNGFVTNTCNDSESLFLYLKSIIPNLIILDIMLPGMDGYEIFRLLKSNPRYANIPIIMLTAKAEEKDLILALKLGADDYITKPFSPRGLVARIKALFKLRDEKNSYAQSLLDIHPGTYFTNTSV